MTYTFQKIISDHQEVPAMVKVKVLHATFVIPQEIIHIVRSHTLVK